MKTKVTCPICNKQYKELNTAHLSKHDLTVSEFDKQYPKHDRLSEYSRKQKATFTGRSHTQKHKDHMKTKMVGKNVGKTRSESFKKHNSNIMIKRWKDTPDSWKCRTLEGYIEKYGMTEGNKKWTTKNLKMSISSKKIHGSNDDYITYKTEVLRVTSISLRHFGHTLVNLDKRGKGQYNLDHKVSMCFGFNNDISPYVIGSIYNLEMLKEYDNMSKQEKCSIDISVLEQEFNNCDFYKKLIVVETEILKLI